MKQNRDRRSMEASVEAGDELEWRRESLAQRLEDGYRRIEQAIAAGDDVAEWERFWIRLLREYEAICDTLQKAA